MISKEREAEISRLFHVENWRIGTIAKQLGVHHSVVRRVLAQEVTNCRMPVQHKRKVDMFLPLIMDTLKKYPKLTAIRLYHMVRSRGYAGKISQFRAIVAELRSPRVREPFLRLKALCGEQTQVDWAHFGQIQCGNTTRTLVGFVMVLSYSRAIFLRFFLSQHLSNFLYGHEQAFGWFGGVTRICLYDNLKSVVLERTGRAIRFNPTFTEFARHYRFEARPVAVARGNEKGRVERAIRYIRSNFFEGRQFKDLEDMNKQAQTWCETAALDRQWQDDLKRTVREVLSEERERLMPLPATVFPCDERFSVTVDKTPYIRFDLNDYTVPPELVGRTVTLTASLDTVRILDGMNEVVAHPRCYERGREIKKLEHIDAIKEIKTGAATHGGAHVLCENLPSAAALLEHMADRRLPLANATKQLLSMLHTYGPVACERALQEALANNAPHPHAVRHILERERQRTGKRPALELPFADDDRIQQLVVKAPDLRVYDNLTEKADESKKHHKP